MYERCLPTLVVLAVALLVWSPADAEAQSIDERTPITGSVDVELGPYYPSIDGEFGQATPFRDSFGGNDNLMGELGVTYYLFKQHGKLGLEFGAGYTKFSGDSSLQNQDSGNDDSGSGGSDGERANGGANGAGSDGESGSSGESGGPLSLEEETNFVLFPLRLSLTYRWDFLAQDLNIPLAPRVGTGIDYYIWKVTDGSGNVAESNGERARGATPGYHVSAGLGFLLDFITPSLAAVFDADWGVNNTYLYGEFEFTRVQPFQGEGFNLSDETWKIGLSFEF